MYVRERNAIQPRNPGIPPLAENGCLFLLFNLAPIVIVENHALPLETQHQPVLCS